MEGERPDLNYDETIYGNREILILLGEITLPTWARQLIYAKVKSSPSARESLEYELGKVERFWQSSDQSENTKKWYEDRKAEILARHQKLIESRVEYKYDSLCNRSSMIEYRDRAQDLAERYLEKTDSGMHMQSTADAYFMREASKLKQEMVEFVNDFLDSHGGRFVGLDVNDSSDNLVKDLQQKVERALEIQKSSEKYEDICVSLNIRKTDIDWDDEEIRLQFDRESSMTKICLDEHFSYTKNCTKLDQMLASYQQGKPLTLAQRRLLIGNGLLEASDDDAKEYEGVIHVPKEEKYSPTSPILAFPYALSQEMVEVVSKISGGNSYSTGTDEIRGIKVNDRLHDYGETQYVINLFPNGLASEECYEIIRAYFKAIKQFPIVPRPDKNQ